MTAATITEVKITLGGERKTFECELLRRDGVREANVIYRMPEDALVEDLRLPRGTISVGYFWASKPFNLYHWVDDKQRTLGLYFNICDNTRISDNRIEWRDLCVDVLITPDLRCRVLDEEELPDDLEPATLAYIEAARDSLCADPAHLLSVFLARSRNLLRGN